MIEIESTYLPCILKFNNPLVTRQKTIKTLRILLKKYFSYCIKRHIFLKNNEYQTYIKDFTFLVDLILRDREVGNEVRRIRVAATGRK